jgi:hypothetical protein
MIREEPQKSTARIGCAAGLPKKNGGRLSAARIFAEYFLKLF